MGDNWWGDAWDTVTDTTAGWFADDEDTSNNAGQFSNSSVSNYDSNADNPGSDGFSTVTYDSNADNPGSDGFSTVTDSLSSSFYVDDDRWDVSYDDESIWGKVGDFAGDAWDTASDFINTPVGGKTISGALGMLGQYLMDESASDKSRAMVGQAEGMMGGYDGPPEEEKVVEATTSNLGKW